MALVPRSKRRENEGQVGQVRQDSKREMKKRREKRLKVLAHDDDKTINEKSVKSLLCILVVYSNIKRLSPQIVNPDDFQKLMRSRQIKEQPGATGRGSCARNNRQQKE
jgi:hypothetical protein